VGELEERAVAVGTQHDLDGGGPGRDALGEVGVEGGVLSGRLGEVPAVDGDVEGGEPPAEAGQMDLRPYGVSPSGRTMKATLGAEMKEERWLV
jgi:hypothetical protein